jgi:undecaprenyl-diphosphatase
MSPTLVQIIVLAVIQGAAELLPVSSSAHVIVAEKLMRLDPASPEMMFLLIMLHAGTMGAVIAFFWKSWGRSFFPNRAAAGRAVLWIAAATAATGVVGFPLKIFIERVVLRDHPGAAVEDLASNLPLLAACLAVAGAVIVTAGLRSRPGGDGAGQPGSQGATLSAAPSLIIGAVQGLCVPLRGLSRSGATISTGMLLGAPKRACEEFSFALGVVITPPIMVREFQRFYQSRAASNAAVHVGALVTPGLVGMSFSFLAGLVALRWLSRWLEGGRWHYFGYYCFAAAAGVGAMAAMGY